MDDKYMELYTKLSRLQWLLQRNHLQTHAEHGPTANPTRGQGRVLAMLKLQPEISTKDLSYLLGIRQQSLNELLNKLEKGGFVVREPSEQDRRVMLVKLTEKGKSEQQPRAELPDIFDCLTEEEQARFGDYLDRVIAALEAQLTAEEREHIEEWMNAFRSRMGDDQFERLMTAWGGRRPPRGEWGGFDERFGRGHGPHDRGPHGHDPRHGCPGHRPDRRGPAPEGMPGAERFDPACDGPLPDGRGPCRRAAGRPCPPPPPPAPKEPHDPDDEK